MVRKSALLLLALVAMGGCAAETVSTTAPFGTAIDAPIATPIATPIVPGPPTQASGPTAPQPPFTQAQADLCYKQTSSIIDAWWAAGGSQNVWYPSSRDEILKLLNPTLAAMIAVQQSGSGLLEPALSTGIAQLESLRDQLSQPMTADAISQAGTQFRAVVASVDFLNDPSGLVNPALYPGGNNPNCPVIKAWVAANVKK